jgi:hypothetical protein
VRSRIASRSLVVALAALGLAACSGADVSRTDISNRLKSDPQFKVLNDKQRGCIADLMLKKGNKGDLKKWVDGDKKMDDVRGDSAGIQADAMKCATG